MHEIRVTVPATDGAKVARVAMTAGLREVTVQDAYVYGPNARRAVVSVSVSTPEAKAFVDALFAADWFDPNQHTITSRELRAIVGRDVLRNVTRPMAEPAIDVLEDLWQLCHVTPSYVARATGAAVLLAYGMLQNSPIAIVVAALFLPFLSDVLACTLGLWSGESALARQGALALTTSTILSIAAGAVVSWVHGGPLGFSDFQRPAVSFAISAVIGVAAGLSSADDAGRRYLIGVAAAVQYAIYPVWIGYGLVHGFPDPAAVGVRLGTFAINLLTIGGTAAVAYAWTGMGREEVHRFRSKITRRRSLGPASGQVTSLSERRVSDR